MDFAGGALHLPFTRPEEPEKADWRPPEMSPLVKLYLEEIKLARKCEFDAGT